METIFVFVGKMKTFNVEVFNANLSLNPFLSFVSLTLINRWKKLYFVIVFYTSIKVSLSTPV